MPPFPMEMEKVSSPDDAAVPVIRDYMVDVERGLTSRGGFKSWAEAA